MTTKRLFRILGVLVFVIIGFLIFLCFFQFPSMDDYVGSYLKRYYGGLQPAISVYLTFGNGRFATIPLFLTVSSSPFLMNHYAFVLIFFILLTILSVFCFVRVLDRLFFNKTLSVKYSIGITGLMLMVFLTAVPEVASFFFWLATSTTYLISFCVFLFLIISYAALFNKGFRTSWLIATSVLTVIAAGSNEVAMVYSFAIPSIILFVYIVSRRKLPWQVFFLVGLNILLIFLVTRIPGLKNRAFNYTQKQAALASAVGGVYRAWQSLLFIFANPLFYVSCLGVYISSAYLNSKFLQRISLKRTNWLMECGIILAVMVAFHFLVRQFGGEIVPPRAGNLINCLTIVAFWAVILANADRIYSVSWVQANKVALTKAFLVLFTVALGLSSFTAQLFKNIVGAPVHAKVLRQREAAIQEARNYNRHAVVIRPYAIESKAVLEQWFPAKKKVYQ